MKDCLEQEIEFTNKYTHAQYLRGIQQLRPARCSFKQAIHTMSSCSKCCLDVSLFVPTLLLEDDFVTYLHQFELCSLLFLCM